MTIKGLRRGPSLGFGESRENICVLCGGHDFGLIYPANVEGDVPIEEFACTTGALAQHDAIIQCRRCGMVSAMSTLAHDEIVDSYTRVVDERYLAEEAARRELFSWVAGAMDGFLLRGRRLFEVGANMGLFLDVARGHGWDVRGVEPSKWAVEQGNQRFGVNLRQGTIEEMEEEPGSADVVAMFDVLEHLADPLAGLRRLRDVIDDEGLLVVSTVNLSGLHARVRKGDWPWFIRSHLHYFSPETFHAMLRQAGFRMVDWRIVPRTFHASYIAARAGEHGAVGRAARALAKLSDPRIPVGWLGDITFAAARPEPR